MKRERSGVGAPGRWAFIDLAGRFLDLIGPDVIPNEWLWYGIRRDASNEIQVGGRVAVDKLHCTVLLRLDNEDAVGVLREVAERTEPFTVTPSALKVTTVNQRLSREFEEEVAHIGLELRSPELVALKRRFIQTLVEREGDKEETDLDAIKRLTATHNPYNSKVGGHVSIAYLRPSAIADATKLAARINQKLASINGYGLRVDKLKIISRGSSLETIPLGNYIPLECRAISFTELERFVADHKAALDDTMTTADVVERFIIPMTKRMACSYATILSMYSNLAPSNTEQKSVAPIGRVVHFVSHAWSCLFLDLVSAIRTHADMFAEAQSGEKHSTSEEGTYYWLDIFAVNQHNIHSNAELPKLQDAIATSREILFVLNPWEAPVAITRIWCLYEVLTAMNTKTPVRVVMSHQQQDLFTTVLARDFRVIRERLLEIDAANAQASKVADMQNIRAQIEATVGYNALNALVKDQIREWLLENVERRMNGDIEKFDFMRKSHDPAAQAEANILCDWMLTMARFFGEFGKLDDARELYEMAYEHRLGTLGKDHLSTIEAANDLGWLLGKVGQESQAEHLFQEQETVLQALIESFSDEIREKTVANSETYNLNDKLLDVRNNRAMVIGSQGSQRHSEALELYSDVLARRNVLHGNYYNLKSMNVLNNMAWLLGKMGRHEDAEKISEQVLEQRQREFGSKHPGTLNAMQNLGATKMKLDKLDQAAELLEKSARGKLENMGISNPSTMRTICTYAECLCISGNRDNATTWAAMIVAQEKVPGGVLDSLRKLKLIE